MPYSELPSPLEGESFGWWKKVRLRERHTAQAVQITTSKGSYLSYHQLGWIGTDGVNQDTKTKLGETVCLRVSPGLNPVSQFTPSAPIHIDIWEGASGASADAPRFGLKSNSVSNARK